MRRVVVTGMGMITAIGCGVQDNWKKLISSTSGIKLIDSFKTDDLTSRVGGIISDELINSNFSDKEKRKMDKFILYSLIASEEAIKNSLFATVGNTSMRERKLYFLACLSDGNYMVTSQLQTETLLFYYKCLVCLTVTSVTR